MQLFRKGALLISALLLLGSQLFAQYAASLDTTFQPNLNGIPFSAAGYVNCAGIEVVDGSVYAGFSAMNNVPKIRKFDLLGNEDATYMANHMSTWSKNYSTCYIEPERTPDGKPNGCFFVGGRSTANEAGIRLVSKVKADGSIDPNFLCPYPSWIQVSKAGFYDETTGTLYYAFGVTGTQVLVSCNGSTGATYQTLALPVGDIRFIRRIPGTNNLLIGGDINYTVGGNSYVGLAAVDLSTFTLKPIVGLTNVITNATIFDAIFVTEQDCAGISTGENIAYIGGAFTSIGSAQGLKSLAKFTVQPNGEWVIDPTYNAGCNGPIADLCYYNCQLVACGNFAGASSKRPIGTNPVDKFVAKVVAFDDGIINPEFILNNVGAGLGGLVSWDGVLVNSYGQGAGRCMAIQDSPDGNGKWEILLGGAFTNYMAWPDRYQRSPRPLIARLQGMSAVINPGFDYELTTLGDYTFQFNSTNEQPVSGCSIWELFESPDGQSWNLIRTGSGDSFTDTTLLISTWYRIKRTSQACGNFCSASYIFIKEMNECVVSNQGAVLRNAYTKPEEITRPIVKIEESKAVTIFPNPANSFINIIDEMAGEQKFVSVYNSIGSNVLSTNYTSSQSSIDISNLPDGVYLVVVTADGKVEKREFVKGN
jgi:hypothetical protein